jgi:hypothetical protein
MRHAFALAFDLAVRRDALHSLVVPLILRSPWVIALFVLPPLEESGHPGQVKLLASAALLGLFLTWIAVDAMLRIRARSVFNTPPGTRPRPVLECYARGIRRLPWLYVTEFVRNLGITFGLGCFVVPGVVLGYRLAFATEAVVLDDRGLAPAFGHSFHLARGRFERWLEMILVSVTMMLGALFLATLIAVLVGRLPWSTWLTVGALMVVALFPVIQYAWTFFYLRLVEVEWPEQEAAEALASSSRISPGEGGTGAA